MEDLTIKKTINNVDVWDKVGEKQQYDIWVYLKWGERNFDMKNDDKPW